jgi:Na+-transporting methylmalonyl-CoA/oxaloacetate decarboxylase gamma subunit
MEEGLRLAAEGMARVFASLWFLAALMYATVWFFRVVAHHSEPASLRSHSDPRAPAPEPPAEILHETEARAAAAVAIAAVMAHRTRRRTR